MLGIHLWSGGTAVHLCSPLKMGFTAGADQVWLFDGKYYVVLIGLLVAWGLMFLELLHSSGARRIASSLPFQICILSAMGVLLLPTTILIPGLNHALVYIAERMSLGVAICVCAFLGPVQPPGGSEWGCCWWRWSSSVSFTVTSASSTPTRTDSRTPSHRLHFRLFTNSSRGSAPAILPVARRGAHRQRERPGHYITVQLRHEKRPVPSGVVRISGSGTN